MTSFERLEQTFREKERRLKFFAALKKLGLEYVKIDYAQFEDPSKKDLNAASSLLKEGTSFDKDAKEFVPYSHLFLPEVLGKDDVTKSTVFFMSRNNPYDKRAPMNLSEEEKKGLLPLLSSENDLNSKDLGFLLQASLLSKLNRKEDTDALELVEVFYLNDSTQRNPRLSTTFTGMRSLKNEMLGQLPAVKQTYHIHFVFIDAQSGNVDALNLDEERKRMEREARCLANYGLLLQKLPKINPEQSAKEASAPVRPLEFYCRSYLHKDPLKSSDNPYFKDALAKAGSYTALLEAVLDKKDHPEIGDYLSSVRDRTTFNGTIRSKKEDLTYAKNKFCSPASFYLDLLLEAETMEETEKNYYLDGITRELSRLSEQTLNPEPERYLDFQFALSGLDMMILKDGSGSDEVKKDAEKIRQDFADLNLSFLRN